MNATTSYSRWLMCLVAAGFAVRIAAIAWMTGLETPPPPGSDEAEYDAIAWNVAQGRGYRGPSPDVTDADHLTAYRTPTTPFLYAAVFRVCGHAYTPLHILNSALGGATVWLIFLIGRQCFDDRAGLLAAACFAFYPMAIYFNLTILSETQAAFLVALFTWCALGIKEPHGLRWAAAAGVVFGVLLLCKPGFVFLLPLLPILGWLSLGANLKHWGRAVVLLLGMFAVLTPWIARNQLVFDRFIPFGTGGGQLLTCGNNRIVVEDPALFGYSVMDSAIPENAGPLAAPDNEMERDAVSRELAITWLSANRDKWFYLLQGKLRRLWTPFYYGSSGRTAALVASLYYGVILLFFVIGLVPITREFVREQHPGLIIHMLVVATIICAVIFHGQHRYRFPIDGLCMVLAAATLLRCLDRVRAHSLTTLGHDFVKPVQTHPRTTVALLVVSLAVAVHWVRDQKHIEDYRHSVCQEKLEQIAIAAARWEQAHQAPLTDLGALVPEFLPNLDCLHCPKHSLGWGEYHVLKRQNAADNRFAVSYAIEERNGVRTVVDQQTEHFGKPANIVLPEFSNGQSVPTGE